MVARIRFYNIGMVKLKRVYEKAEESDGYRVLVDRLWPRGVSKEKAKINLWLKEIAPSTELRKWFNHDPKKWKEFQKKYKKELELNKEVVAKLKEIIKKKEKVTIVYSAADTQHNDAVVLSGLFL